MVAGYNRAMAKKKWMKCVVCGNEGGTFSITPRGPVHKKCRGGGVIRDEAKSVFKFETTMLNADPNAPPIQVNSLHHLRQIEKEHGVVSVIANMDRPDVPVRGGKEQFRDTGVR